MEKERQGVGETERGQNLPSSPYGEQTVRSERMSATDDEIIDEERPEDGKREEETGQDKSEEVSQSRKLRKGNLKRQSSDSTERDQKSGKMELRIFSGSKHTWSQRRKRSQVTQTNRKLTRSRNQRVKRMIGASHGNPAHSVKDGLRCLQSGAKRVYLTELEDRLGDRCSQTIANNLAENSTCRSFHFSYNHLSDIGFSRICEGLLRNGTIRRLDLGMNVIRLEDASAVTVRNSSRKSSMYQHRLTEPVRQSPQDPIEVEKKRYKTFDGQRNIHGLADFDHFIANLSVESLILSNNLIGEIGLKKLVQGLTQNTTILRLYLSFNPLGSGGAKSMGAALKQNLTLQVLELNSVGLRNRGVELLADGLKGGDSKLEQLSLSHNYLSDKCEAPLIRLLKTMKKLRILVLRNNLFCKLQSKFYEAVFTEVPIELLDLGCNDLVTESLTALLKVVSESNLCELYLDQLYRSKIGTEEFIRVLNTTVQSTPRLRALDFFQTPGNDCERIKEIQAEVFLRKKKVIELITKEVSSTDDDAIVFCKDIISVVSTEIGLIAFTLAIKKLEQQVSLLNQTQNGFRNLMKKALSSLTADKAVILNVIVQVKTLGGSKKEVSPLVLDLLSTLEKYDFDFSGCLDQLMQCTDKRVVEFAKRYKARHMSVPAFSSSARGFSFSSGRSYASHIFEGRFALNTKRPPLYKSSRTVVSLANDVEHKNQEVLLKIFYEPRELAKVRLEKELQVRENLKAMSTEDEFESQIVDYIPHGTSNVRGGQSEDVFLVLKERGSTLLQVAEEAKVAAADVRFIQDFAKSAANILSFINNSNYSHMDFSPENIVLTKPSEGSKTSRARANTRPHGNKNALFSRFLKTKEAPSSVESNAPSHRWKMIDFDSVRKHGDVLSAADVTELCLSTAYMAPELAAILYLDEKELDTKEVKVTEKLDVWSFGVVLFELLAGIPLFDLHNHKTSQLFTTFAKTQLAQFDGVPIRKLDKVLQGATKKNNPLISTDELDGLKSSAKKLISGCLHPDPQKRFSIQDVLAHDFIRRALPEPSRSPMNLLQVRTEIVSRQGVQKRRKKLNLLYSSKKSSKSLSEGEDPGPDLPANAGFEDEENIALMKARSNSYSTATLSKASGIGRKYTQVKNLKLQRSVRKFLRRKNNRPDV